MELLQERKKLSKIAATHILSNKKLKKEKTKTGKRVKKH